MLLAWGDDPEMQNRQESTQKIQALGVELGRQNYLETVNGYASHHDQGFKGNAPLQNTDNTK